MIFSVLFSFLLISQPSWALMSSSLDSKCKKDGFNCGECETDLQTDFNKLLEEFTGTPLSGPGHWGDFNVPDESFVDWKPPTVEESLEKIAALFKKHNPAGNGQLNFVVIGESESLHETTIRDGKMYPRIMLKSPNSELMVTFNTDPKANGYEAIEIMRWNGKKGEYDFQELNFGDKKTKPHLDLSGQKCMECHKAPSARPNWDTYRAWAGVVPSRDDMLEIETQAVPGVGTISKGLQPDARAYLGFLDQVAEDKDKGKKTRLSILDIPVDSEGQLKLYKDQIPGMTNKEKVELIKRSAETNGFYRIMHFPNLQTPDATSKLSFNFDQKTADLAGPSQFAFDQMLAQNMCRISVDLQKHPKFDEFKYPLAYLYKCTNIPADIMSTMPDEFKKFVFDRFKSKQFGSLTEIDPAKRNEKEITDFKSLANYVRYDTELSHERADSYKFNRHERFLENYLTTIEGKSKKDSQSESQYYAESVKTPYRVSYHAIEDFGGVKGVPEGHSTEIAMTRLLLEPFGVDVSHWSLVHGKDAAYNSFSFSDQFELLIDQPIFEQLKQEAGSCDELEKKAIASMKSVQPEEAKIAINEFQGEFEGVCSQLSALQEMSSIDPDILQSLWMPLVTSMESQMKKDLGKCLTCHGDKGVMTFPGLEDYVNDTQNSSKSSKKFVDFLQTRSESYGLNYDELIPYKLGVHDVNPYGMNMPPTDWADNSRYAQDYGVDPLNVQNIRRKNLGLFVSMYATVYGDSGDIISLCEQVKKDRKGKESSLGVKSGERRGVKAE